LLYWHIYFWGLAS